MTIYTIGYTAFDVKSFIKVLKKYNINCVIDVRSNPQSTYYTDYDKDNLKKILEKNNILYRNYKLEFGARQTDKNFYNEEGWLDFEKFTQSKNFNKGYEKVENALKLKYSIALMCAEKDPMNCHRSIMIGRELKNRKFNVQHILYNESTESQDEIEKKLLEKYYKNLNQISFFDKQKTQEDLIKEAYKKRNKEIAYIREEEENYE